MIPMWRGLSDSRESEHRLSRPKAAEPVVRLGDYTLSLKIAYSSAFSV